MMSESEVLTVVVLTQWQPSRSEGAFLRSVRQHWRAYFPRVLSQSAFNRRARTYWGLLPWLSSPDQSESCSVLSNATPSSRPATCSSLG
jgi:hypothetical protein